MRTLEIKMLELLVHKHSWSDFHLEEKALMASRQNRRKTRKRHMILHKNILQQRKAYMKLGSAEHEQTLRLACLVCLPRTSASSLWRVVLLLLFVRAVTQSHHKLLLILVCRNRQPWRPLRLEWRHARVPHKVV